MVRALGVNPSSALQHPGFYYYVAAHCTEMRRARFMDALGAMSPASANSPGFANERKVEHLVIILEVSSLSAYGPLRLIICGAMQALHQSLRALQEVHAGIRLAAWPPDPLHRL